MPLSVPQHAVLESEATHADIALKWLLSSVRSYMALQVLHIWEAFGAKDAVELAVLEGKPAEMTFT